MLSLIHKVLQKHKAKNAPNFRFSKTELLSEILDIFTTSNYKILHLIHLWRCILNLRSPQCYIYENYNIQNWSNVLFGPAHPTIQPIAYELFKVPQKSPSQKLLSKILVKDLHGWRLRIRFYSMCCTLLLKPGVAVFNQCDHGRHWIPIIQ
jgi:hypothetical protein